MSSEAPCRFSTLAAGITTVRSSLWMTASPSAARSVTRSSPIAPCDARWAAMLTGSPRAVKSLVLFDPTIPTNAVPVCTPAPIGTQGPSGEPWPVTRSSSWAVSTARAVCSGPVRNGMNRPTISSPTNFSMIASPSIRTRLDSR